MFQVGIDCLVQYMFNTPDSDVVRFLRILTFLDMADVAAIEAEMAEEGYVPNSAQRRLAEEVRAPYRTVLNCTALHLYCIVLHCFALHWTVLYSTVLCCTVL